MTGADELRKRRSRKPFASRLTLNGQRGEQRANTKEEKVRLLLLRSESALVAISAPSFVMMTPSNSTSLM